MGAVKRVPMVMQMEALECGAAALSMILAYYGKWIPLEQVRETCGVSRDGSSAKNLIVAARNYGLEAHGYRVNPEGLEGMQPAIIHWSIFHTSVPMRAFLPASCSAAEAGFQNFTVPALCFSCVFTLYK